VSAQLKKGKVRLPENIRLEIADRMVRVIVPVMAAILAVHVIGSFLLLESYEYYRLIAVFIILTAVVPAWILVLKGKSHAALLVIFVFINGAWLVQMIVSGGNTLGVFATVTIVTPYIVLYGLRGGVLYALFALTVTGLFVFFDFPPLARNVEPSSSVYSLFNLAIYLSSQILAVIIPVKIMAEALTDLQGVTQEKSAVAAELNSILERTPDLIFKTDKDQKIVFINKAVERYGYRPEEVIGTDIQDIIHPEDKENNDFRSHERTSLEKSNHQFKIRLQSDGRILDENVEFPQYSNIFFVKTNTIFDEETKNCIGYQGIARDISEEERNLAKLRKFAAVIEQTEDEVVITDENGIIQYVNPAFEKNSGYTRDELLGSRPSIFKSGIHEESLYRELWSTIENKRTWKGQFYNKLKGGDIVLHDAAITPIVDAEGNISAYVSIQRDITEKVRTEQRLQQLQKMEALGTLAGGIAHDFNNILGALMGFAELVKESLPEQSESYRRQDQVIKASLRAKKLIEQILLFSRQEEKEIKPVQPHFIITEALKLIRASIPSTIEIKQSIPNNLGYVVADSTHIHQIVMNLCTNAYHAMRDAGGILDVTLSKLDISEGDSSFSRIGLAAGRYMVLEVSDTGHGIPPEMIEKIFNPYFTTKEKSEGTGLGLSVVHGIVKNYGGVIKVYSDPGLGTNIRIYLPRVEMDVSSERKNEPGPLRGGEEHIMVVDDEPSMLEMMEITLHSLGYRVSSFTDSYEAVEAFESEPDRFDLIITDVTMPHLTGLDLTARIYTIKPGMPIILCTGFSELTTKERAESLGIKNFLLKPVLRRDLSEAIRKALDIQR